jgi:RNA polymerase sigma factor (sigma-70 family)
VPAFLPKTDTELDAFPDDELIAYVRRARAAREDAEARTALQILVYGHWANVERRVKLKVPEQYVEDVAGEVLVSAIKSAFDGRSVGEFITWLNTITKRRIADFYRRGVHRTVPLDDEDGVPIQLEAISQDGAVEVRDAIDRVLGRLSADHQRVVEIVIFEDQPAAAAMAEVDGLSENNAHQIVRRFRTALKDELEAKPDTGD